MLKACLHLTFACAPTFDAKNGINGYKWRCLHFTFQFSRMGRQKSKENADVTCKQGLNIYSIPMWLIPRDQSRVLCVIMVTMYDTVPGRFSRNSCKFCKLLIVIQCWQLAELFIISDYEHFSVCPVLALMLSHYTWTRTGADINLLPLIVVVPNPVSVPVLLSVNTPLLLQLNVVWKGPLSQQCYM